MSNWKFLNIIQWEEGLMFAFYRFDFCFFFAFFSFVHFLLCFWIFMWCLSLISFMFVHFDQKAPFESINRSIKSSSALERWLSKTVSTTKKKNQQFHIQYGKRQHEIFWNVKSSRFCNQKKAQKPMKFVFVTKQ